MKTTLMAILVLLLCACDHTRSRLDDKPLVAGSRHCAKVQILDHGICGYITVKTADGRITEVSATGGSTPCNFPKVGQHGELCVDVTSYNEDSYYFAYFKEDQ